MSLAVSSTLSTASPALFQSDFAPSAMLSNTPPPGSAEPSAEPPADPPRADAPSALSAEPPAPTCTPQNCEVQSRCSCDSAGLAASASACPAADASPVSGAVCSADTSADAAGALS